ncbi:hypothetical protein GCM10025762_50420 [Haloechinothrix salitolerans]
MAKPALSTAANAASYLAFGRASAPVPVVLVVCAAVRGYLTTTPVPSSVATNPPSPLGARSRCRK